MGGGGGGGGALDLDFQSSASNAFALAIELLEPGSQVLTSQDGNDGLSGNNNRNDILIGVNSSNLNPGRGEIDTLTGLGGVDTFVLGDDAASYYDDGVYDNIGIADYGLITDFSVGQQDVIQLHGDAADYQLGASPQGVPNGTAIFLKTADQDELIAVVQGTAELDLSSPSFKYV